MIYFLVLIILILLWIILKNTNKKSEIKEYKESETNYSKFVTNYYVMTQTELKFYRELKKATDELELTIFPQVDLERFINVEDKNNIDRNKIKSRSIDYTIVNKDNCKIVCCIELDDYTHKWENVKKADKFKNELFEHVKIPLYRIEVKEKYDIKKLKEIIKN